MPNASSYQYPPAHRVVQGLRSAKLTTAPALYAKAPKMKGARAKGRTYERTVGRRLKARIASGEIPAELREGQWFLYTDDNGPGYCQTDYYLLCPGFIILIECKLTQNSSAETQMALLYKPILEMVYKVPVVTLQVCKNLRGHPKLRVMDIMDLVKVPRPGLWTWHYLG